MIKIILPIILIFLIIIFWEKIKIYLKKKFRLNLNYIIIATLIGLLVFILMLLYY